MTKLITIMHAEIRMYDNLVLIATGGHYGLHIFFTKNVYS